MATFKLKTMRREVVGEYEELPPIKQLWEIAHARDERLNLWLGSLVFTRFHPDPEWLNRI